MPELVALSLAPGPGLVEAISTIWESGDAFTVIDPRLPSSEIDRVLAAVAPTAIQDIDGRRKLDGGRPTEDGDAIVLATSGTTGEPKGVVLTLEAVKASAMATSKRLQIDPASDKWLCCLPLSHIGGLSVVTRALLTGTPLEIHPNFDATAVMSAAKGGATRVSLVTRAMRQIDPAAFTTILLGGGPKPADCPPNAIATYGMTETGSGLIYGATALDGVEMRIDADGQILLKGPMLLRCYRSASQDMNPFDADGWFPTGDAGSIDDNGVLSVSGRMGDMISTGGEKVWPVRLERLLQQQPNVAEVAVIGRTDSEWGQRVVAIVVAKPDATPPTLEQLAAVAKAEFGSWYAPKQLEIVDAMPKTGLGKIRRAELS